MDVFFVFIQQFDQQVGTIPRTKDITAEYISGNKKGQLPSKRTQTLAKENPLRKIRHM